MFEMMPFSHRNHLSVYDPFQEIEKFEKSLFSGFGDMFRTDIHEKDGAYVLEADLPGMKKEDITVDIDGDCLTISAQRHSELEEKDENHSYVRRERSYGSYTRSFDISGVKAEEISGSYENGVLTLTMPKKDSEVPTSRRLEIK